MVFKIIKKIAIVDKLEESTKEKFDIVTSFLINKFEFFIPLEEGFDKDKEINKLTKELDYYRSFLKSVEIKLKNENILIIAQSIDGNFSNNNRDFSL